MPEPETSEYVLSPEERTLLAEYLNAIRDLEAQKNGALQLIVRSRKLEGTWNLIGTEKLVKNQPAPAAQQGQGSNK